MATCALVATCDFNGDDYASRVSSGEVDFTIAVDGGFRHLQIGGYVPDLAIGDFDSLGFVPTEGEVIQHPVHKDKSDLEISLEYAHERKFDRVIVYGALGGRLDHTIAALQTCARFAEMGMGVTLVGEDVAVEILVGPAQCHLAAMKQGTVSVFSATDQSFGVSESGMEYPLHDAVLTNRTTLGLSNEFVGEPVTVSVERGTLYVFHPVGV